MQIQTTRFGSLTISSEDALTFPAGLLGMSDLKQWVLLADRSNDALAWLQSLSRPDVAFAVVWPRTFVPGYQLRLTKSELAPLELENPRQGEVLAVVGKNDHGLTLNLKAPLVIHVARRLGRQVVASDDQPVQYELAPEPQSWRKTA